MRIAFYAPLKPPDHPTPSGDRHMARELMAALSERGHAVTLVSRLRALDKAGDLARQREIAGAARAEAARLIAGWIADPASRPDLWLTYHCHHKAPDWIGPEVAMQLGLPYALVEASIAGKQAHGPWESGHHASIAAVGQAGRIFCPNPGDREGLLPHVAAPSVLVDLPPFLDPAPLALAGRDRARYRADWASRLGLEDNGTIWLVVAAMMRADVKRASYGVLGRALRLLPEGPAWRLLVAGDGPARPGIERDFNGLPVCFAGALEEEALTALMAAGDIFVWPAIGEAFGYALLEAQGSGLPVIAGASPGVAGIVAEGETGLLAPQGDPAAFAAALAGLLGDPDRRQAMRLAALARVAGRHSRAAAGAVLERELQALIPGGEGGR